MIATFSEFESVCRQREVRMVEVKRDHYELTFWPRKKTNEELFNEPRPDLTTEALAELSTPPEFTYITDPLNCERMAGVRARPSIPIASPRRRCSSTSVASNIPRRTS